MKYRLNTFMDEKKEKVFPKSVTVKYLVAGVLFLGETFKDTITVGELNRTIRTSKMVLGDDVEVIVQVHN